MTSGVRLQEPGDADLNHGLGQLSFEFDCIGDIFIDLHQEIRFATLFQEPAGDPGVNFNRAQQLPDALFRRCRLRRINPVIDIV